MLMLYVNMSNKTSTDCNDINTNTAKRCINVIVKTIANPLTNIFNKYINTSVFPEVKFNQLWNNITFDIIVKKKRKIFEMLE